LDRSHREFPWEGTLAGQSVRSHSSSQRTVIGAKTRTQTPGFVVCISRAADVFRVGESSAQFLSNPIPSRTQGPSESRKPLPNPPGAPGPQCHWFEEERSSPQSRPQLKASSRRFRVGQGYGFGSPRLPMPDGCVSLNTITVGIFSHIASGDFRSLSSLPNQWVDHRTQGVLFVGHTKRGEC